LLAFGRITKLFALFALSSLEDIWEPVLNAKILPEEIS